MQAGWVLCHEPEPRVRGPEGRVSAGSPWSRCAAQREPGLSADGRAGRQRLPAAPAATLWLLPQLVSAGAGGMGCTSGYGGCPTSDVSPDTQTARGVRSCGTGLAAEKHLRGALTLRMSPPSSRPTTGDPMLVGFYSPCHLVALVNRHDLHPEWVPVLLQQFSLCGREELTLRVFERTLRKELTSGTLQRCLILWSCLGYLGRKQAAKF